MSITVTHMSSIKQIQSATSTGEYPDAERESLKTEVYNLLKEAGSEDWDGEDALPLMPETVAIAQKLIDEFPCYISRPDVAATPHGEVDFDWVTDRDVMLTVSVCPSKAIAFAGLFNGTQVRGSEEWKGTLPRFVKNCFEQLLDA